MNDPDAIWRPGYDGPSPTVDPPAPVCEPSSGDPGGDGPAERRPRRRWFAAGIALCLVVAAAVVVFDPFGADPVAERLDPSVFGGPAARRLPGSATTLWSADLESAGDHWVDVVGRELVIAALVESSAAPVTTIVALDAPTGARRWTVQLAARPQEVTVIGAVDDVVVLEQPGVNGPALTGVDLMTGETRWSADDVSNGGHVGLVGTRFIARLPSPAEQLVTLIDATSGSEVGAIVSDPMAPGRPGGWFTDRRGRWYVVDDGDVVEYDLGAGLGEATIVGSADDVSTPRTAVGGRLATVDDSGSMTVEGAGGSSPVTVSTDVPAPVGSLTRVSGSNVVVTAPGSIAGVAIDGDTANVTWSQDQGVVVADHPVDDGTILQVATRGGAAMQLVDGRTGETVEQLTMVPGALQALVVAGDGIVALRISDLGATLAGLDLDGNQRWSIAGSVPVVVGDRIVVRATPVDVPDAESARSARQLRIVTYGDVG